MTATPAVTVLTTVQVEAARASDRQALRNYLSHIAPRIHDLLVDPGWDGLSVEEQFELLARVIVNELENARAEFLDGRDYVTTTAAPRSPSPPARKREGTPSMSDTRRPLTTTTKGKRHA